MLPRSRFPGAMATVAILVALAGCAAISERRSPTTATPLPNKEQAEHVEHLIRVVRYGRYSLVELRPEAGQRELSRQIVDVAFPSQVPATVGAALRHLLAHSGYSLCDAEDEGAQALYRLPLPAAHRHLGPMVLRDALQTLAGYGWRLALDDSNRQVCFIRQPGDSASPSNGEIS
ncbi:TPA: PilL N-terminal domain-containing protein [Pseudomonas aeruginosa]